MYSMFTYIWVIYGVNLSKYATHGAYGIEDIFLSMFLWNKPETKLWLFWLGLQAAGWSHRSLFNPETFMAILRQGCLEAVLRLSCSCTHNNIQKKYVGKNHWHFNTYAWTHIYLSCYLPLYMASVQIFNLKLYLSHTQKFIWNISCITYSGIRSDIYSGILPDTYFGILSDM